MKPHVEAGGRSYNHNETLRAGLTLRTNIAVAAVTLALAATVSASPWVGSVSRITYLTFSGPVALPGVQLSAGTYMFELTDSYVNTDIVRVSSRDRSKVYLTAFTKTVARPANLPTDGTVTFDESPRGGATPIKAWFPMHSTNGHQFIYTK